MITVHEPALLVGEENAIAVPVVGNPGVSIEAADCLLYYLGTDGTAPAVDIPAVRRGVERNHFSARASSWATPRPCSYIWPRSFSADAFPWRAERSNHSTATVSSRSTPCPLA